MPDCDYCGASFDEEGAYYEHLDSHHADELGAIDRRRVAQHLGDDEGSDLPTGPLILIGVIGFALLLVAYVIFFVGDGSGPSGPSATVNGIDVAQTPANVGQSDFHGRINVTIAGERLDFSQERFQRQDSAFHFENGGGEIWHGHADGLTLQYAMATLGINVTDSTVSYEGTTYRDSDPRTTVAVLVDGEDVDPERYELSGIPNMNQAGNGDFIEIVVTTNSSA